MAIQSSNFGSLTQSAQLQKLKSAKTALWLVGILTILFQTFQFFHAEKEYEDALQAVVTKNGGSMAALQNLDESQKAELAKERTDVVAKLHLIYGASIGLGVVFIGCALMVNRKPVIATMTGLVLYLGSIAAVAVFDASTLAQGIVMKVIVVGVLASAVKAAIAYERDQRSKVA